MPIVSPSVGSVMELDLELELEDVYHKVGPTLDAESSYVLLHLSNVFQTLAAINLWLFRCGSMTHERYIVSQFITQAGVVCYVQDSLLIDGESILENWPTDVEFIRLHNLFKRFLTYKTRPFGWGAAAA